MNEAIYYSNKTKYIVPYGVYDYRESVAEDIANTLDTYELEGKDEDEMQRLIRVAIHLRAKKIGKLATALKRGYYAINERTAVKYLKGNETLIKLADSHEEPHLCNINFLNHSDNLQENFIDTKPQKLDLKIREYLMNTLEVQNLAEYKIRQKWSEYDKGRIYKRI